MVSGMHAGREAFLLRVWDGLRHRRRRGGRGSYAYLGCTKWIVAGRVGVPRMRATVYEAAREPMGDGRRCRRVAARESALEAVRGLNGDGPEERVDWRLCGRVLS